MATLHNEYFRFCREITITGKNKEFLVTSRNALKKKIKKYFKEKKKDELQPKFWGQGSFDSKTLNEPILEQDSDGNILRKFDLDYGIYFIEKEGEDNKKSIDTWHNWIYNAVEDHTNTPPVRKTTCVRVIFSDGHHIDLPIYYKDGDVPELAHRSKGWIESDPKEFVEWFNDEAKKNQQLRRIVRYLKAWKNYKEVNNTNLKFPSGFSLTILAVNNYVPDERDDVAFKETLNKIKQTLDVTFECLRPTTPKDEDIFADFSETRENNFMNALGSLLNDCEKAIDEKNFKKASEKLRKHFGSRFPLGKDENEEDKSNRLAALIGSTPVTTKPYICLTKNSEM